MNSIVLDLEWNQAQTRDREAPGLTFEVIEIGAVRLDEHGNQTDSFSCLIRPCVYTELFYRVREVVGISMKQLEAEGIPFLDAMERFWKWCGKDPVFFTWGDMDLTELQKNVRYYGMENRFSFPLMYYDVQKLYSLEYSDGKSRISLDHAVEQLELNQERPFHRALDDAVYTGRTLRMIHMETYGIYRSIDYYRLPERGSSYKLKFPEYSKYISGEFDCKEEILKDKEISDIICVKCSRMLRKKIRWFSYGQRFYFALGICPEHGYMKGKIRVKKSEQDLYYAVKTIKAVGEEALPMLVQKREDNKKKKKNSSKQ